MNTGARLVACLLLSLCCRIFAAAQTDSPAPAAQAGRTPVTAAATSERVRFLAHDSAAQLRLEVYTEAGQKVFDTEQRGGNVLDWHLVGGDGSRVPEGAYLCVLTVKDLSGRIRQKLGQVTVGEQGAEVKPVEASALGPAQAAAVGPVEGDAALSIQESGAPPLPVTVIAHDGQDGQLTRTRGALSFRLGDFFSGQDREQMRLTEGGDLGVGVSEPRAKLDVAGTVRAERFLVARKGEAAGKGQAAAAQAGEQDPSDGPGVALASGSGTANRLAKWADNAGTLGDSAVTESAGNVGIGTTSPTGKLELHVPSGQTDLRLTSDAVNSPFTFGGLFPANLGARLTLAGQNEGGLAAQGFTDSDAPAFRFQGHVGSAAPTQPAVIFEGFKTNGGTDRAPLGASEKVFGFYNGGFDAGGALLLTIRGNGNVGVGTPNPLRTLQLGPSPDAAFTFSPSDGSPNAGYIRFGDNTGWKLHFARNRESSGGALNTGTAGELMTIQDNGNVGIGTVSPQAALDVRGDVKLGSTGQYFAPGSEENLRIVRGVFNTNGEVVVGSGFTVSRESSSCAFLVTYNTRFSGTPAVTGTADFSGSSVDTDLLIGTFQGGPTSVQILGQARDGSTACPTTNIHFIAIGPR